MPTVMKTLMLLIIGLLSAAAISGCAAKGGPTYVDQNATYTSESVKALYDCTDISAIAKQAQPDVEKLRHTALAKLRKQAGRAAEAATVITGALPSSTRGVPVYVERATVNGVEALIIIEATGAQDAPLSIKRLWVLDLKGTVMFAGMQQ